MAIFSSKGGLVKARELFGTRLDDLPGDLSDALVARRGVARPAGR